MEPAPRVVVDADYLRTAKIHATILGKICKKMMSDPSITRPQRQAKNKFLEMCEVDGVRYGVTCHRQEDNVIMITFAKRSRR